MMQIVRAPQRPKRHPRAEFYVSHIAHYIPRHTLLVVYFIFTYLVCFSTAIAQNGTGSIKGKVIDRQRNKPLVNQKVILTIHQGETTQQRETMTASDGSYSFDNLSLGMATYYSVSTVHEGMEHLETDLVLSTWVPESKVDIVIGAFTDDHSVVKVRQHSIIIGPPPPDHAPDGAVSVMEIIQIENTSEMDFQTTVNSQSVGMYLNLPNGYEGLQIDSLISKDLAVESNKLISQQPLASGTFGSGFSYIMHIEDSGLNLSRLLTFDTDQLYVFVTEGLPLVPQSSLFGSGRREEFHDTAYIIYATNPAKPLVMGKAASLNLKVAPVASSTGNVGKNTAQPANPKMIALIAFAAACASGFLVAAIFMVRSSGSQTANSGEPQIAPDASWLNKLDSDDLDRARIARLEMVTRLDQMYEKKEISERVYNRLRKEQVDRLTPILEKTRSADHQ
jgi:hypothetical protein